MSPGESRPSASALVRRAQVDDLEAILDLLTHYDLPRTHFEPWYRGDPSYRPNQSWVVEEGGTLVAHVRVFERLMYVGAGTPPIRIAGIGNVITARDARSRGHAGVLLETVIQGLEAEGFEYSLLWTHLPELYRRFGWAQIPEQSARLAASWPSSSSFTIRPFSSPDLTEVMDLYDRTTDGRSGAVVRSVFDWQAQLAILRSLNGRFVVARDRSGTLQGYVRGVRGRDSIELFDLAIAQGAGSAGRDLVAALVEDRSTFVRGPLPAALREAIQPQSFELETVSSLMGRVVDLQPLVLKLEPVWQSRSNASGGHENTSAAVFATRAGLLRLLHGATPRVEHGTSNQEHNLDEAQFGHLLFRGWDEIIDGELGGHPAAGLLRALFPAQDFAIWPADAF